ncbi:hypothetical protein D3C85_1749260 [compost metagenome]
MISCGHKGNKKSFDLIIGKANNGKDRVMHDRITPVPSNFSDKRHSHGLNFSDISDSCRTRDMKFLHDFRNGKMGAVVDIPHDDVNPFYFTHGVP